MKKGQENKENEQSVTKETCHKTCVLVPSSTSLLTDAATHLEVVRQGPWVGFRLVSSVGKDRFLQARRRGVHRMAFFSPHFGTWEQWEFEPQQFGVPWKATIATFRNRRMPSCDFRVEVVRVGTKATDQSNLDANSYSHQNTVLSDQSMNGLGATDAVVTFKEQNPTVKRMSGLLLNEWLTFVEKESRHRAALEARVERAMEDVVGLREWASSQVAGIRKDVEDEVSLLLGALSHRTAEWKDASSRLNTRLQWGATLIQAKRAAILGRRVIHSWMAVTLRARSLSNIESKIRGRMIARTQRNTFQAWAAWTLEQINRRARVRAAVRRMALLKMRQVYVSWKQHTSDVASINNDVIQVTSESLLCKAFGGWRSRTERATLATAAFTAQGARWKARRLEDCFVLWKDRMKEVKLATESLRASVISNADRTSLRTAFIMWQGQVEEAREEAVQVSRVRAILGRRRVSWGLSAWQLAVSEQQAMRAAEKQADAYSQLSLLHGMLTQWCHVTMDAKNTRALLVAFVTQRAARRQSLCWSWWVEKTRWKAATASIINGLTAHRNRNMRHAVITHWRAATVEAKMWRHKEQVVGRHTRALLLRVALRGWQHVASQDMHHHHLVTAFQSHQRESRLSLFLNAWHSATTEATRERRLMQVGDGWYAGRLKARALWGLMDGVERREVAVKRLEAVKMEAFDLVLMKETWLAWKTWVEKQTGLRLAAKRFEAKRYVKYYIAHTAWRAWTMVVQEGEEDRVRRERIDKRGQQRVMGRCFARWRSHVEHDAVALRGEELARIIVAKRSRTLLSESLMSWRRATDDGIGTRIKLNAAGVTIAVSRHERLCRRVFAALRSRVELVQCIVEKTRLTEKATQAVTLRCILSCWKHTTAVRHSMWETRMRRFVDRRVTVCRQRAFVSWLVATRVSVRNSLVALHKVERRALTLSRTAWEAWKQETGARRSRRAALVKLMQRSRLSTLATHWDAWIQTCREAQQHREELERCIVRKRLAFKQFKSWYWESVDEEVHATLQAMFFSCDNITGDGDVSGGVSVSGEELENIPSLLAPTIQRELGQRWSVDESDGSFSVHSQHIAEKQLGRIQMDDEENHVDLGSEFGVHDVHDVRDKVRGNAASEASLKAMHALRPAMNDIAFRGPTLKSTRLTRGSESDGKLNKKILEDKENTDASYLSIFA